MKIKPKVVLEIVKLAVQIVEIAIKVVIIVGATVAMDKGALTWPWFDEVRTRHQGLVEINDERRVESYALGLQSATGTSSQLPAELH